MFEPSPAAQHLAQLRTKLPALRTALHTGDRRHTTHQAVTPEQASARDALLRAERYDVQVMATHGAVPLGASTAPLDLGLLDVLRDIELDLAELEAAVIARVAPALSPAADTPGRIGRLLDLDAQTQAHPDLADHVLAEARRLNRTAASALGDAEPMVRLSGLRCPHCQTLSLRLLVDRDQVVCANVRCECADWLCGCRDVHPTRHIWHRTQWPTLGRNERIAS